MAKAQNQAPSTGSFPKSIKYKVLKTRHDSYMGEFWQKCKALYAGGPKLLNNEPLLKLCMPSHANEALDVYKERLKRAFYIPYPGSIIDQLVAQLMAKPLNFEPEDSTSGKDDGGVEGKKTEEKTEKTEGKKKKKPEKKESEPLPTYYADLVKNCSKPGGVKMTLNQFAREQIFTALQCQTAWALVDLPKAPEQGYPNRAEQDKAGALNAYICPIDPECVIDWEEKEDEELKWVLIQDTFVKRDSIEQGRNMVTMRWRYFRENDWAIYEITFDKTKKATVLDPKKQNQTLEPNETDDVELVAQGKHSFGRVPVRRMRLPEGLWAMGKLEAMARAHLNQRNALSWGQLKALFPVPILYAAPPTPGDPTSEDMGRVNQQHGQGFLRVFAEKDKLEYFSPDAAPYKIAMEDLNNIRDEMHRVLYAMAQSVDNSGAALQRSGESKAVDQAAASVILRALGMYIREHLEDLLSTIATGRKDNMRFSAHGMDNFDDITLSQLVLDAVGIASVSIPSATFQKLFKYKVAKLALGADVTEDDLDTIKEELESGVTQDEFEAEAMAKTIGHEATAAQAEATVDDPQGIKAAKALGKTKAPPAKKSKGKPKKKK